MQLLDDLFPGSSSLFATPKQHFLVCLPRIFEAIRPKDATTFLYTSILHEQQRNAHTTK